LNKQENVVLIEKSKNSLKIITEIGKAEDSYLGLQVFDVLFIAEQPLFSKIETILHEFLHWLNFRTLDLSLIDKIIDLS
jgi:hypothetical protein